jgi:hypothetical protein
MAKKSIYKVIFLNQGKIYELYAKGVAQSEMYGFVQISGITFGERTAVVVDPSEERLKNEFAEVKSTFIPMHAVIRIDEVAKEGTAKVHPASGTGTNVTPFPIPMYTPGGDSGSS